MEIFSVYDSKAESYLQPIFAPNAAVAVRMFSNAVNQEGHDFGKFAQDYTLFHLGEWNEKEAKITMKRAPESLGNALQFVFDKKFPRKVVVQGGE